MNTIFEDTFQLRPRYGEVDQMGYVYHANYVAYCHTARTELLRKLGINDLVLENHGFMLPVINMNLQYKKPVTYDELITIKTAIKEMPATRFSFEFEFYNEANELVCQAYSETAFINSKTRKPIRVPELIKEAFLEKTKICR